MLIYTINCDDDECIVTIKEECFKGTADNYENAICHNMCVCEDISEAECIANSLNDTLYDNENSVSFSEVEIPAEYMRYIEKIRESNSMVEETIGMQITADLLDNLDAHIYAALIEKDLCFDEPEHRYECSYTALICMLPEPIRENIREALATRISPENVQKGMDGRLCDIEDVIGKQEQQELFGLLFTECRR